MVKKPTRFVKDTIHLGVSSNIIFPVCSLLHYLHIRDGDPGSLFCHTNGLPLTRATLTTWLRTAVSRAGIEENFSGHSFCIGAATSAAEMVEQHIPIIHTDAPLYFRHRARAYCL